MKKEYLLRKHILFELFDFEGVRNQIIESRKWFVEDGILYNPKESESDYFDYVDIFTYSKKEFEFRENFSEWLENEIKSAKSYVGIKDRFVEYVKNNNKYIVHNSVKDFVARYIAENIDKCTNVESINGLQLINDNDVFQMYNLPYVFQRKGVTA